MEGWKNRRMDGMMEGNTDPILQDPSGYRWQYKKKKKYQSVRVLLNFAPLP